MSSGKIQFQTKRINVIAYARTACQFVRNDLVNDDDDDDDDDASHQRTCNHVKY